MEKKHAPCNIYEYFCIPKDSNIELHKPNEPNKLGLNFNATLPARAGTPFKSDNGIEINETITIGEREFIFASVGKIKLINGPKLSVSKIVYNGVVYDIVK